MKKEVYLRLETVIDYYDHSGTWEKIWLAHFKDLLETKYYSFGPENKATSRSLSTLNINMSIPSQHVLSLFSIYVINLSVKGELSKGEKEAFKNKYKTPHFVVVLLPLPPEDTSIKHFPKVLDKLKKELDLQSLTFLPVTKNYNEIIKKTYNEFFEVFKNRVEKEFNRKMSYYSSIIDKNDEDQKMYLEQENAYHFLSVKFKYLNQLVLAESWEEVKSICSKDLFKNIKVITEPFPIHDPIALFLYDDSSIMKKIQDKTLSNIEIQQAYCFYYIIACKSLEDFDSLNSFLFLILEQIDSFLSGFVSSYHYYFWTYQMMLSIFNHMKTFKMESFKNYNYTTAIMSQIKVLEYIKMILNNYAKAIKAIIPTESIFQMAIEHDQEYITKEIAKSLTVVVKEIESNEEYIKFQKDLQKCYKQNIKQMFSNHKSFLEEYLLNMERADQLTIQLGYKNLSIKNNIEMFPIYFALEKYDKLKVVLIEKMIILKGSKWSFINEYITFILVLLLNCLEKNEDNLVKLLKCVDIKLTKVSELIKKINSTDINIITNLVSKYIKSFDLYTEDSNVAVFSMDNILHIDFKDFTNKSIFINMIKDKEIEIPIEVKNSSGFAFTVNKVLLVFEELYSKEKTEFITQGFSKEIMPFSNDNQSKLVMKCDNVFKGNLQYRIKEIHFITPNHIRGIYTVEELKSFVFNVKTIDMKVNTIILNNYSLRSNNENQKVLPECTDKVIYYNILSKLYINMANIPDMTDKSLHIIIDNTLNRDDGGSEIKIAKEIYEIKDNITYPNNTSIDYNQGKHDFSKGELNIPFYIEDVNFYNSNDKVFIIHFLLKQNDQIIYSFSQTHQVHQCHFFSLSNRFRPMHNNTYLMQSSISLNIEQKGLTVYLDKNDLDLAPNQTFNTVLILPSEFEKLKDELMKNMIRFSIGNQCESYFIYPSKDITEEVKILIGMPYYITIESHPSQNKKATVFQEYNISVSIQKLVQEEVMIISQMKESDHWVTIGKSKIITKMTKEQKKIELLFKIFPLHEGFLKIPEIEFYEFSEACNNESNNLQLESSFQPVIKNNERIVKIEAVNSSILRLNLID